MALEGVHRKLSLYKVLTHSQKEPINNGLANKWDDQRKNPTLKPDLQPTGHPVSGQAPHLAARPGEAAKGGTLMDFIITFTSLALEGVHKRLSLYVVLTHFKVNYFENKKITPNSE